jgi:hypothetical protein
MGIKFSKGVTLGFIKGKTHNATAKSSIKKPVKGFVFLKRPTNTRQK